MPLYKTNAVIIKTFPINEADKIVTFFTEKYGKISGVAKGARKLKSRFVGTLETLTLTEIFYFGKENQNLYKINSSDPIKFYHNIKKDLTRFFEASCILDILNTLLKDSYVSAGIYNLLKSTLTIIDSAKDINLILSIFEIRLMSILGYMPELCRCTYCKVKGENSFLLFDYERKGVVCNSCATVKRNTTPINLGTVQFLLKAMDMRLEMIDRLKAPYGLENEIQTLTQRYTTLHTSREIKSYRVKKQLHNAHYL